jgi:hypothetical protein
LAKANIGAQKLVAKLKGEKASWQEKYLNLLEGNKRPREEEPDTSDAKRRSDTKSPSTSLDISSNNLFRRQIFSHIITSIFKQFFKNLNAHFKERIRE